MKAKPKACSHPYHIWSQGKAMPCRCGHYKTYGMYEAIRGLATNVKRVTPAGGFRGQ
jgi:hypothetical protein